MLTLDVGNRARHHLARERRDILNRMEEAGLIMPLPPREDMDPYDVDPVAAWYEWVEYTRSCGDEWL